MEKLSRPNVSVTSNPFPDFILPSHPKAPLSVPPPTTQSQNQATVLVTPASSLLTRKRHGRRLRLKSAPTAEKIRKINERRGKYKRSTNNSHKKFISVAHRLLLRLLSTKQKSQFQMRFAALQNSRSYFLIILAWANGKLEAAAIKQFTEGFKLVMQNRLEVYKQEMNSSCNRNFINFRCGQITDIEYALKAMHLYFEGFSEQAVDALYRRDRTALLKKQQYDKALETLKEIQTELRGKQPSKDCLEKEIKEEIRDVPQQKQMPLLQLENSYPIYEHFYPIMFSFEGLKEPVYLSTAHKFEILENKQLSTCRVLRKNPNIRSFISADLPT